jgi:hypothetical protein
VAPTVINLSNTVPAPPAGSMNVAFQGDSNNPRNVSSNVPIIGGSISKSSNYAVQAGDCGQLIITAAAITFTLPTTVPIVDDPVTGANRWKVSFQNIGTGVVTISLGSPRTLDGSASSVTLQGGQGLDVFTDGTNYLSMRGLGTTSNVRQSVVGVSENGNTNPITTGFKGFIQVPYAGTIIGWSILCDLAGSSSFDIWKIASSAPPTAPSIPTSSNKISASAPAATSSAQSAASGASGVSTWTTSVAQWDVFGFNLTSVATITRYVLEIQIQRT